jgi:FlaA1/EpsC-like NDP-sugar epimerase
LVRKIDIPIVVTGPRPGEKLREVLHSADEHTQPTPHPQVVRVLGMRWPLSQAELEATVDECLAYVDELLAKPLPERRRPVTGS